MRLVQDRIRRIAERLDEAGVTDRHRTETRQEFETIYGITPENAADRLETVFKIVIQARSQPLRQEQYERILDTAAPEAVLEMDSRRAVFETLYDQHQIGQKIANEYLRIAVDVLEIRPEWQADLHVALDTNVIQALRKTGAIDLEGASEDRGAERIVNMNPTSEPRKLIAYQAIQDAFESAAEAVSHPRILFDELWTEHRRFIADPLLRDESVLSELLQSGTEARR